MSNSEISNHLISKWKWHRFGWVLYIFLPFQLLFYFKLLLSQVQIMVSWTLDNESLITFHCRLAIIYLQHRCFISLWPFLPKRTWTYKWCLLETCPLSRQLSFLFANGEHENFLWCLTSIFAILFILRHFTNSITLKWNISWIQKWHWLKDIYRRRFPKFCFKQRSWVLVRTTRMRSFNSLNFHLRLKLITGLSVFLKYCYAADTENWGIETVLTIIYNLTKTFNRKSPKKINNNNKFASMMSIKAAQYGGRCILCTDLLIWLDDHKSVRSLY